MHARSLFQRWDLDLQGQSTVSNPVCHDPLLAAILLQKSNLGGVARSQSLLGSSILGNSDQLSGVFVCNCTNNGLIASYFLQWFELLLD